MAEPTTTRIARSLLDPNDPLRAIHAAGYGEPTPDTRAGRLQPELRNPPPRPGSDGFEQRIARSLNDAGTIAGVPQAGLAIGNAVVDPTLGHITDAGAKTALALFQPAKAVGALGAGFGAAAIQDSGILDNITPSANAQAGSDPLDAGSRARLQQLQTKVQRGNTLSRAEREEQNSYLSTLATASGEAAKAAAAAKLETDKAGLSEYTGAIKRAGEARDAELKRVRRFSGTKMGEVYNDVGGAPALALAFGGGAGILDRLAKGAPKTGWDYARLAGEGTGGAAIGNNFALGYDAFATDSDNPEKAAYTAYARELPANHPRKKEFTDFAASQPLANPVKAEAQKELYDPWKFAERTGMSAIEGIPTAWTAANIPSAIKNGAKGAASLPGAILEGYESGMAKAGAARGARRLDDEAQQLEQAARRAEGASRGPLIGGQVVPPAGAVPAAPGQTTTVRGQPLPREPLQNRSSAIPPAGENATAVGVNNQEILDTAKRIAAALEGGAGRKMLSAHGPTPGVGPWAETISPAAREAILEHVSAGGNIAPRSGLSEPMLSRMIDAKLPDGTKRPGQSEVRGRLSGLRDVAGNEPTAAVLQKLFAAAPDALLKGKKIPAIVATGAAASQMTPEDDFVARIARKL